MGALNVINNEIRTEAQVQAITVNNATNANTANNANQLGGVASTNYARKDSAAGTQTFAVPLRVTGTETRSGETVGITSSSNIGAFVP